MIEAWFDGVCEPINPGGHAAYGAVVKIDGSTVMAKGAYVGQGPSMSNNVAEYAGVIAVLDEIATMSGHDAVIYGDSLLVINQLNGEWRAKGGLYFDSYLSAKDKLANLPMSVRLRWILRERNAECDSLSKAVLRERGIRFQLQAEEDDKDQRRGEGTWWRVDGVWCIKIRGKKEGDEVRVTRRGGTRETHILGPLVKPGVHALSE